MIRQHTTTLVLTPHKFMSVACHLPKAECILPKQHTHASEQQTYRKWCLRSSLYHYFLQDTIIWLSLITKEDFNK